MNELIARHILKPLLVALGSLGFVKTLQVDNKPFKCPLNHPFFTWRLNPVFGRNLVRLAALVDPDSVIIDVGASIGDTYALLRSNSVSNPLLLIEGGAKALSYLSFNTRHDTRVTIYPSLVGPDCSFTYSESSSSGITSVNLSIDSSNQLVSLDDALTQLDLSCNRIELLKVDTDGFDTQVLRSAEKLLSNQKPIVFIEAQLYHWRNNDSIATSLQYLSNLGYLSALCWDNGGRFLCPIGTTDGLLPYLLAYFHGAPGNRFLDIAFFHIESRAYSAALISEKETIHYKEAFQ